ncbi:hypothetical protein D3C87_716180 [compost metagenome]
MPLTGPFSLPFVPAVTEAIEEPLSVMFTVAGVALAIISVLLVVGFMVKITVSVPSTMLSFNTGTDTVAVVCPAGMVIVLPIEV